LELLPSLEVADRQPTAGVIQLRGILRQPTALIQQEMLQSTVYVLLNVILLVFLLYMPGILCWVCFVYYFQVGGKYEKEEEAS
jgi:hypothetical protein